MTYLTDDYIGGVLKSLRAGHAVAFDQEAEPPAMSGIDPLRDALMLLIQRGLAELDYSGIDVMIRATSTETPVMPATDLPYEVTPAIMALRARRAALGR